MRESLLQLTPSAHTIHFHGAGSTAPVQGPDFPQGGARQSPVENPTPLGTASAESFVNKHLVQAR